MYCILIAGMPASGKSRFAQWLSDRRGIPWFSKDAYKEALFDTVGFRSREEKVALGEAAAHILWDTARRQMQVGSPFILENNFEDGCKETVRELLEFYHCPVVTVLFDGDTEILYRRFLMRDQSPERHRGHVVNTRYPETERAPYVPLSLDAFASGMEQRGFRRFSVGGAVVRVDTTNFYEVEYDAIDRSITKALKEFYQVEME